ncbi:MAG TPA: T9SS type A sorting domain-containing protein [Cyclobacteriaceae bacterium]|nr:T9SS type A sorting domain-containing protein [Cyclobacteriaceae bacterium]
MRSAINEKNRCFIAWRLLVLIGATALLFADPANGQTIHYDSGYTWRAYTGTTAPTCPDRLCHHYPMYTWDSYYKEFTAWKSSDGLANSASAFINFRVIFPPGYNIHDNSRKYPLIIMLHGAGESGREWTGYFNYDPSDTHYDNNGGNLANGGNEHRIAVAKPASDPGSFPGIVVFPQSSYNGTWGDPASSTLSEGEELLVGFIEKQLVGRYHVDINRIAIHGLSNGADALWALAQKRPDLFAAILPMAGIPKDFDKASTILLTTPIRLYQGGIDTNPAPTAAQDVITAFVSKGGNPQFILYPLLGHGVWNSAYKELDFFSWMLAKDKRKIYVFGSPELCPGQSLRLGFSANMLSYQWTKDGKDIAVPRERYLENINFLGSYTVKFQRPNGEWDESFPVNVVQKAGCAITTGIGSDTVAVTIGNDNDAVYPNPARDKVVIILSEPFELSSLRVVSVQGLAIQAPAEKTSDRSAEVDLTELSKGLYVLHVRGNSRFFKVVKE